MNTIKAKFLCQTITKNAYGQETAKFTSVCDGSPENNSYAKATPSAALEMTVDNPAAQGFFVPGDSYYCEFTKAV